MTSQTQTNADFSVIRRFAQRARPTRRFAYHTHFTKLPSTWLYCIAVALGSDWPWPSRLNLTEKSQFTPILSLPIQFKQVSKLGPKMHLSTNKITINFSNLGFIVNIKTIFDYTHMYWGGGSHLQYIYYFVPCTDPSISWWYFGV